MTIDHWVLGLAFVLLVVIQSLWALDLLLAELRRAILARRWRWLLRSGPVWLALFNISTGILHGWFAWILLRTPFDPTGLEVSLLIFMMAGSAFLAWYLIPREPPGPGISDGY